jgi:hypothetical protein
MARFPQEPPCPAWLEEEALIIEHAGEMPEVALAESLLQLGPLPAREQACLQAACGRGYAAAVRRDLDPAAVGRPEFRGLERALANWRRLKSFAGRAGQGLDPELARELAGRLAALVQAEAQAADAGRAWTAAAPAAVRELAAELGLEPGPWQEALARLEGLAAPDFLGLRALARLQGAAGAAAKRRRKKGDKALLELTDGAGRVVAGAALPWRSDVAEVARENRQRAELVWALLPQPPEERGQP